MKLKMEYLKWTILPMMLCIGIGCNAPKEMISAMTYNIRYASPNDGVNIWDNRKTAIVDLFQYYQPEIFGIQEGLDHQVRYIENALPNYQRVGVGRDDGKTAGEYTAIYFNKDKFELVEHQTFWLSKTPEQVSVGWDASMERICTYALLRSLASKQKMIVFNAHYDHIGEQARINSSKLIIAKMKEVNPNGYPVIIMGDFNAEPNSKPIMTLAEELLDGGMECPLGIYGPFGTFTGFVPGARAEKRIDYIFFKGFQVLSYRHIDDKRMENNYISDHLPIFSELLLKY